MTALCSWAACHKPAAGTADDWPMCRPHLSMHHEMAFEEVRPEAQADLDELIRLRWRQGKTDGEISREVGIYPEQVRGRRRIMGLTRTLRAKCGTRAGFSRHRDSRESPCPACRAEERAYQAVAKRTQRNRRRAA